MAQGEVYAFTNVTTPNTPVIINEEICNGCNECVEVCLLDVFIPNPVAGQPPIILHPEECWHDGSCSFACPNGAITHNYPLMQRAQWKRKETGELFYA